jgi:micrococcal nuclease
MKPEKYHLILGVVTGILCVAALGQIERSELGESMLIAPANPVLTGIKQLDVVIAARGADPNKNGLDIKTLKTEVERRLEKAGIKVFVHKEGVSYELAISSDLKISIEMLKLGDSQQCVFRVQTSLSRAVCLNEQRNLLFKVDVWTTKPVMQTEQLQNISGKVTKAALAQVETFIQAYHTANTAGSRLPDVNITAPTEISKAPSREPVAGYKYVASKNSDVFHTPNCRSAKRISPENIIGYNSRDDAINAGKRPCKVCKP